MCSECGPSMRSVHNHVVVWVLSSMCQLSVNENRGSVQPYTDWNANDYLGYAHLPVKPHNDFYSISDIAANGQAISGEVISIMAVVKHVSASRYYCPFTSIHTLHFVVLAALKI